MANLKKKKKKKKDYWTIEHEDAIKKYLSLEPNDPQAEALFKKTIYPALRELVENIAFTYHLTRQETSIKEQIDDCIGHIVYKFRKYDPEKGSKAFSYYGTVAKNYFILSVNRSHNIKLKTTEIDNIEGSELNLNLSVDHEYEEAMDSQQFFIMHLADRFTYALENDLNIKTNTWKLGEAIIYILNNYAHINIGTKNTFYHIVREMTGLSTKEISNSLRELKSIYKETRDEFLDTKMTR